MNRRLLIAVAAVQLAVPTVALVRAPSQYGFQMYSGAGWTSVVVERADGTKVYIDPRKYAARYRMDIDWTKRLPEHICARYDGAVSVAVTRRHGSRNVACT